RACHWCRSSAWRRHSAACRTRGRDERRRAVAVPPPARARAVRSRLPARLLPAAVALWPRDRPAHRRGPRARSLDRRPVGPGAGGTTRLRLAAGGYPGAVLPRAVAGSPAAGRSLLLGRPGELAPARKGSRPRPTGGIPRRRLPPAPHVARAHERDDRDVGHDLAKPGDRARAIRARGGPAAPLVRSVARRPLCAHRGTAR